MQMVQFPSFEECKQAFREHMADPKWLFECRLSTIASEGGASRTKDEADVSSEDEDDAMMQLFYETARAVAVKK
jgi:hypothetical protein